MVFENAAADTQGTQQHRGGPPSGPAARYLTYAGGLMFALVAVAGIVYLSRFEVEELRTLARHFMETARGGAVGPALRLPDLYRGRVRILSRHGDEPRNLHGVRAGLWVFLCPGRR